jgi:predicted MFS family arabinose efflux permease
MLPLSLVAGLLIAPALTAQTLMISRLAPPQYATEAFTWSSTFIVSGIGIGTAVAGWLIETVGLASAFATAAALLTCAAALSMAMRSPAVEPHAPPGP